MLTIRISYRAVSFILATALIAGTLLGLGRGVSRAQSEQGILPGGCVVSTGEQARLDANRETVLAYYDLSFNQGEPEKACELYQGEHYIQHNPHAADGAEAFIAFVNWFRGEHPELHMEFVRTIAEGDLVLTHSHQTLFPGDRGTAVMDIFRLEDGKIVEHWDVVQPVPEEAANDNTMF
ncbi:nuclear transport factor 2 family protein [bacterium]|nr:nuclear transport factor 2 family protein [bacterium]